MSYCTWSSLSGYSDVYVYEYNDGIWRTHVGTQRQPAGVPVGFGELQIRAVYPEKEGAWQDAFCELVHEMEVIERDWFTDVCHETIDHPDAGRKFIHNSPGECADNLMRLANEGFIIPLSAVLDLRAEQEELDRPEQSAQGKESWIMSMVRRVMGGVS